MSHDKKNNEPEKLIDDWMTKNRRALDRWDKLLALLHSSSNVEYTMFFIAIRELMGLIMASSHQP